MIKAAEERKPVPSCLVQLADRTQSSHFGEEVIDAALTQRPPVYARWCSASKLLTPEIGSSRAEGSQRRQSCIVACHGPPRSLTVQFYESPSKMGSRRMSRCSKCKAGCGHVTPFAPSRVAVSSTNLIVQRRCMQLGQATCKKPTSSTNPWWTLQTIVLSPDRP